MTNSISHLKTDPEVLDMIEALKKVPVITVDEDRDAGTVVATHPASGEIFRAIDKGTGSWIVTMKNNLFSDT